MNQQEVYNYLKSVGCCEVCSLRYFGARGNEYEDIDKTFKQLNILNIGSKSDHPDEKKKRINPCTACLGLFSAEFLDEITTAITTNSDLNKFDCNDIVLAISFPMLLQVRQLIIWLSLIENFGEHFNTTKSPDVPLKEVVKLIINPNIYRKLCKNFDPNGIMVNLIFDHNDESTYIEKIKDLERSALTAKQIKNRKKIVITRNLLEKNYTPNNINLDEFKKYFNIPPDVPTDCLSLTNITLKGPTVFLAGRYRKLSRELSHSPWILHGNRVMDDSIQEIIIRNSSAYFGVPDETIIFSSSGREDVDVRCLGKGRPFVLEIPNSKRIVLAKDIAAKIENEIEKSLKISVNHLQMVQREDLVHIKAGEENKKKIYRALCILKNPVTLEILNKLDMPNGFEIFQITPLRVLHRRPLHTRPRMIYSVKPYISTKNNHTVILDMVTQAGTYVKELVHGEFGRTNPSISSIISETIDIIALDVIGIDLNWPPEINNKLVLDTA